MNDKREVKVKCQYYIRSSSSSHIQVIVAVVIQYITQPNTWRISCINIISVIFSYP